MEVHFARGRHWGVLEETCVASDARAFDSHNDVAFHVQRLRMEPCSEPQTVWRPWSYSILQFHSARRNASALVVANVRALQHTETMHAGIAAFFRRHRRVDYTFFQRPHHDCFFDYLDDLMNDVQNSSHPWCVSLHHLGGNQRDKIGRDRVLWKLLQEQTRVAMFDLVPPWGQATKYVNREVQFADPAHRIDTRSLVQSFPCAAPACANVAWGHQCHASSIALLARALVTAAAPAGPVCDFDVGHQRSP